MVARIAKSSTGVKRREVLQFKLAVEPSINTARYTLSISTFLQLAIVLDAVG